MAPGGEAYGSPSPAVFGQAVTFTVSLGGPGPQFAPPTGTVTVKDGGVPIGTAVLVPNPPGSTYAATATLTGPSLAVGSHPISGSFPGDGNYPVQLSARTP